MENPGLEVVVDKDGVALLASYGRPTALLAFTTPTQTRYVPARIDDRTELDDELLARHAHLYIPDRDVRYLRRNALIALGNAPAGERELARRYADDPDPQLRAAARRALTGPTE